MAVARRTEGDIFYEDAGSGDPTLLFVHGIGNHQHFRPQIEYFSERHRVVAPDLPGFGLSDAPQRNYGVSTYADDLAWLCAQAGVEAAAVVGHSMGGAIALELAAAHPDLVESVVLLDPTPIVALPLFAERMGAFVDALRGPAYEQVLRGFAEAMMFLPTDDARIRAQLVDDIAASPQHVAVATMSSVATWRGEDVVPAVRARVLLVSAGDGMPSDLSKTRELLPDLELGRTVGAGHFAHVMVPSQVNAMIDRFLSRALLTPQR
jgi:pimeloyl-ACP methyl ester carboxylesterase